MPKRPRFVNQIRLLRTEYLKLTQPQFARLIGVSASMLQAVELGMRGTRYSDATGLSSSNVATAEEPSSGCEPVDAASGCRCNKGSDWN